MTDQQLTAISIPALLDGILTATAEEASAKARIARYRATLEETARERYRTEGAAPTWKAPGAGTVAFTAPGEWKATIGDPVAFAEWAAQNHPANVAATINLNADDLEAALNALRFAGIEATATVTPRPAWVGTWLDSLEVEVTEPTDEHDERTHVIVDPTDGLLPDGLTITRSTGGLRVTLDRDRRSAAIRAAEEQATQTITSATPEASVPALADRQAHVEARRRELEGMTVADLRALAAEAEVPASGTKAVLAERIARTEALGGNATGDLLDTPASRAYLTEQGNPSESVPAGQPDEQTTPSVAEQDVDDAAARLLEHSAEQLRVTARRAGLPVSGNKVTLAERLATAGVTEVEA